MKNVAVTISVPKLIYERPLKLQKHLVNLCKLIYSAKKILYLLSLLLHFSIYLNFDMRGRKLISQGLNSYIFIQAFDIECSKSDSHLLNIFVLFASIKSF